MIWNSQAQVQRRDQEIKIENTPLFSRLMARLRNECNVYQGIAREKERKMQG